MAKRKGISKRVRFEVFKRDSFKCQYCGKSAPDVLLRVDHIHPVSKGGADELLNLITACFDCNAGKSNVLLDDDAAIKKQREQLEALNERREQLEMMLKWRDGLKQLTQDQVDIVVAAFDDIIPGRSLNDVGRESVRKLIGKFPITSILDGIETAKRQYIKYDDNGQATQESASLALHKLGGICGLQNMDEGERRLYYIRGIVRNRLDYYVHYECMDLLKRGLQVGLPIDYMSHLAREASSWTRWKNWMLDAIAEQIKENGADGSGS